MSQTTPGAPTDLPHPRDPREIFVVGYSERTCAAPSAFEKSRNLTFRIDPTFRVATLQSIEVANISASELGSAYSLVQRCTPSRTSGISAGSKSTYQCQCISCIFRGKEASWSRDPMGKEDIRCRNSRKIRCSDDRFLITTPRTWSSTTLYISSLFSKY